MGTTSQLDQGVKKVFWVTTIANITAPTAAEMTAGTDITAWLTVDGLNEGLSTNRADDSDLSSRFNKEFRGDEGAQPELTMKRLDAVETLFGTPDTAGHLVVAPDGVATGKPCRVTTCTTLRPRYPNPAKNERQKIIIGLAASAYDDSGAFAA